MLNSMLNSMLDSMLNCAMLNCSILSHSNRAMRRCQQHGQFRLRTLDDIMQLSRR